VVQIKQLRDELSKLSKTATIRVALRVVKEVKTLIEQSRATPQQGVSPGGADSETNTKPLEILEGTAPALSSGDARPEANTAPVLTADMGAWKIKLAEGLQDLRHSEHVRAAVQVAAPSLLEDANNSLNSLTPDQVTRLHDELVKLQAQDDSIAPKPRALVRAMQALYAAESAEDASLSLSVETADEEALHQLTERTQEFAPALEAMRSVAVDCAIFDHLKDKATEDVTEKPDSESEGSDLEALIGKKECSRWFSHQAGV